MTSSVINLQSWRAAHPRFYGCGACGAKLFRILDTGGVRCARCAAQIVPAPPSSIVASLLALLRGKSDHRTRRST
jgi:DNA-directed RNA polymerase subunit RPC12/RpoP